MRAIARAINDLDHISEIITCILQLKM